MEKFFSSIKMILEYVLSLLVFKMIAFIFPKVSKISILFYISLAIFIVLANYKGFKALFSKKKGEIVSSKNLFNIYYINFNKVYEICMLINNERKEQKEYHYQDTNVDKENITFGLNLSKNSNALTPTYSNENIKTKLNEYKEIQQIKETNSTYLNEIIDKCQIIGNNNSKKEIKNLSNGELVKIKNVKLKILNESEIAQATSMVSGIFNNNSISTSSNGQTFNINIDAIGNILLKDYKYNLVGTVGNTRLYISIPIKANKEFENDYSIYDLEIGKVDLIGICKDCDYNYENNSTFNYLQKLGEIEENSGDELLKSNSKSKKSNTKENHKGMYIDLIAITQDLQINKEKNNE